MVDIARTVDEFREARTKLAGTVAFVPTMGALHEGHLSLMREANRRADHLVVSIFVNPTQFEPGSDFDEYPRELERDRSKCEEHDCDLIFAPTTDEMYADQHSTTVAVEGLTDVMCGPHRPGHFEGVTTIVTKLFNVVDPDVAVFGRKDFQQLAILRRMVRDLNMDVDIVGAPTVREADGLAVSSRNRYLSKEERRRARAVPESLARAWRAYREGTENPDELVREVRERLLEDVEASAIDYVECVHPETLERLDGEQARVEPEVGAVVATAAHVGEARLIDHVHLEEPLPDELAD